MPHSAARSLQDEAIDSLEFPRVTFEDLLVQQANINRQLAQEHDRVVAELQRELEQVRASPGSALNAPPKPAWSPPAPPPKQQSLPPRQTITTPPPLLNLDVKAPALADTSMQAELPVVEPKNKTLDNPSTFFAEVPATIQFLDPQGFKKGKKEDQKTFPTGPSNEDTRTSTDAGSKPKHLSLPGRVGQCASPDSSSSGTSEDDAAPVKSLSWCPSAAEGDRDRTRKQSLSVLNPLNWLLQKDEPEAPPSITVEASTEVVPSNNVHHPSVASSAGPNSRRHSLSANIASGGSRRPSFSGEGARRPSLTPLDAGSRKPSFSGSGSRRGSRRGSRVHSVGAGSITAPPLAKTYFEPWPVWSSALDAENHEHWERISNMSRHSVLVDAYRKLKSVDFTKQDFDGFIGWALQNCVMHPSSLKRMLWVSLSGILITYDIVMTPLRVFDLKDTVFMEVLTWVTMFFWTFDMIMSPFVGYHYQFNLEMRVKKTAYRYLTTWFAFDLLLVSSDWILLFFGELMGDKGVEGARTLRTAKTFRMARALRSLRLLRVVKMPDIIKDTTFMVGRSEYTSLTLGILKHLAGILLVNHLIACLWYVVGEAKDGWVSEYCQNCSVHMLYFTSLHWSLTQFTPATMAVQPQNFGERFFAVSVLLFALITFSSFVSSITNLMTHLRNLRSVETKQYVKLERYLHDRGISFHLSIRVRRYLEHVLGEKARHLEESDIELLAKLSTPLHMELRYEVHFPILSRHPFFKHLAMCNMQVMQRLCLEALKSSHAGAGDSLFCVGDSAHAMYFVERGILLYSKQAAFSIAASPEMIESGNWCCEAILWTPWEHRGEMRALTEANLLALQATKFHDIMSKNKTAAQQPAAYAAEVVDALNAMERQELSDVDTAKQKEEKLTWVKEAFEIDDESIADGNYPHKANVTHAIHKMATKVATFTPKRNSEEHK